MFQLSSALFCLLPTASAFAYDATWESLDSRPNPIWYDEAKVGIFIHWGVFSVPSYGSEWFWSYWRDKWGIGDDIAKFVSATESPNFAYPDYAHRFDATLYRPDDWAQIFAESGAQYVILTSKHHEGFCNWDSRNISLTWNWNAMDIGPRRDLLGDLAYALRKPSVRSNQTKLPLKFGVYHSLYEWYNPLYHSDKANNFTTQHFLDKTMEELYHLVKTYKPEIIWSDGEWDAHSDYWKSKEFLAWLANDSPVKDTAVWNDRWGSDSLCKHGGFLTCTDRYEPDSTSPKKWENAMTIDRNSWGWNRNASFAEYLTTTELVHTLISTISKNGNLNINIGPAADGTISPILVDRLLGLGDWLKVNGEAVYQTRPWGVCSNDTDGVYYTRSKDTLYAHLTHWPKGNRIALTCPLWTTDTNAYMVGLNKDDNLSVKVEDAVERTGMTLQLPPLTPDLIPNQHAWVIGIKRIGNLDGFTQTGQVESE